MGLPFTVLSYDPQTSVPKIPGAAVIVSKLPLCTLGRVSHLYFSRFYKNGKATTMHPFSTGLTFFLCRWGVNETIKSHAQNISNATGLHTVVPDLYKGKVGLTAEVSLSLSRTCFNKLFLT
jgi:hypothetical protein